MADYETFARSYEALEHWLAQPKLLPVLQRELQRLIEQLERNADADLKDEICDRFYKNLEFGTGGLRSLIGAGSNRFNIYTVRWAVQGICNFLWIIQNNLIAALACNKYSIVCKINICQIDSNAFAYSDAGSQKQHQDGIVAFARMVMEFLLSIC